MELQSDLLQYSAVFVLGFVLDVCYTLWVRAVASQQRWKASLASAMLVVPSALSFTVIVGDLWALLPYAAGLAAGTWVAMGGRK